MHGECNRAVGADCSKELSPVSNLFQPVGPSRIEEFETASREGLTSTPPELVVKHDGELPSPVQQPQIGMPTFPRPLKAYGAVAAPPAKDPGQVLGREPESRVASSAQRAFKAKKWRQSDFVESCLRSVRRPSKVGSQ